MLRKVARNQHLDWLSIAEPYGSFVTTSVMTSAFPQGLDRVETSDREIVRSMIGVGLLDSSKRTAWIEWTLRELLGWSNLLIERQGINERYRAYAPQFGEFLHADYALSDTKDTNTARCLVKVVESRSGQRSSGENRGVPAADIEKFSTHLRLVDHPLGIITDGNDWHVIWVPKDHASGGGVFRSELFSEEPNLLNAFVSLFHARRFFAFDDESTIEGLLTRSETGQIDVANLLGSQVKGAMSILVATLGKINVNSNGSTLEGVDQEEIFAGLLTVLMRIIFLLYAEERGLLPFEDNIYRENYSVSLLLDRLQEEADLLGEEPLSRRSSAWFRMLALFRAVHSGIDHVEMRMPAYGGSFFDPDRYGFLEGHRHGSRANETTNPIPFDDLTILQILKRLQILGVREGGGVDARRLSYANLEVEQIGHVYETLLDGATEWVTSTSLVLETKEGNGTTVELSALETQLHMGEEALVAFLKVKTGLTERQIKKRLSEQPSNDSLKLLEVVVDYDDEIVKRVKSFLTLVSIDNDNLPRVLLKGHLSFTTSATRASGGVQYTPRELADEMAEYSLEHLVYYPGPREESDPTKWRLQSSDEILNLKVCDPTVGSGSILVACGRYLAKRVVDAWEIEGLTLNDVPYEEAFINAFRKVVERCLYGVDRDPLAIEMAKLSLWLSTMAKDRPFSFVDHALKVGDSLLGVINLQQIANMHLDTYRGRQIHDDLFSFTSQIEPLIVEARKLRTELEDIETIDILDAQDKATKTRQADLAVSEIRVIGDLVVGAILAGGEKKISQEVNLTLAARRVKSALDLDRQSRERKQEFSELRQIAYEWLNQGKPTSAMDRHCFHWAIEFPEVFDRNTRLTASDQEDKGNFDAVVGNPPFLGAKKISPALGYDLRTYVVDQLASGTSGNSDLVSYFFLRGASITGSLGLIATNTISQGDTSSVGLGQILSSSNSEIEKWCITRAVSSTIWPGAASVRIAKVWLSKGGWDGYRLLDGVQVSKIDAMLEVGSRSGWTKETLLSAKGFCFIGSYVLGVDGFTMSPEEAGALIESNAQNKDVLFPYLGGEELNSRPDQSAPRWVINFFDWEEDRAREYPEIFDIVELKVKPERATKDAEKYPKMVNQWWRYWNERVELYAKIKTMPRVLVTSRVTKFVHPSFVDTGVVFSEATCVFAYDDDFHFGVLNSGFHVQWALLNTSTMKDDTRYAPTDVFETFVQPPYSIEVETAGKELNEFRTNYMLDSWQGLTTVYNRFHDESDATPEIIRLRDLHSKLDYAVRDAYGWQDIELEHGFHEVKHQGVRFTFSAKAIREILERLLEANKSVYENEQEAFASNRAVKGKKGTKIPNSKKSNLDSRYEESF